MASQGKGTGIVGYNVQTAVETKHHLIVTHEVTNVGSDRAQLVKMAQAAREATSACCYPSRSDWWNAVAPTLIGSP